MAEVGIIYLPPGEGAKKQGVDDFLATGHTVEDLISHATTELREHPESAGAAEEPATQAAVLVRYADDADLFHTPDGTSYAAFPVEDR